MKDKYILKKPQPPKDIYNPSLKTNPITLDEMKKFGLEDYENRVKFVDTLDELRKKPPVIVIAECIHTIKFLQNRFKQQELKRKENYVMALGIYRQLRNEPTTNERILKPAKVQFKNIYKPYRGENLNHKTIFFSRTGGVGDLLFLNPIMRYLKNKYPTCKIKFACGPQYRSMLETWPMIDEVVDLPFSVKHLYTSDYHAIFEGVIERTREAHTVNAYTLFSRWLNLDIPDEELLPKQSPKKEKVEECRRVLDSWGIKENEFIMLQMRASSPIRSPSPMFWRRLIKELVMSGNKIVIMDSPPYAEGVEKFIQTLDEKEDVFNFAKFSTSLDCSIAMAALSKLGVGTDSALVHICESLSRKSFGIYGPFPAEIRVSFYKHCSWINSEVECAPCFIHGHMPCPNSFGQNGYSSCYEKLEIGEIMNKIKGLMVEN
jgi:ADP-heptose:LPS heptosyltransferase